MVLRYFLCASLGYLRRPILLEDAGRRIIARGVSPNQSACTLVWSTVVKAIFIRRARGGKAWLIGASLCAPHATARHMARPHKSPPTVESQPCHFWITRMQRIIREHGIMLKMIEPMRGGRMSSQGILSSSDGRMRGTNSDLKPSA